MNIERMHAIASAIASDLKKNNVVSLLESLTTSLQNQISNPADTSHQQAVSKTYQELLAALEKQATNSFPPTWKRQLDELGLAPFFGTELVSRVRTIFSQNQITVVLAHEEMKKLHETVAAVIKCFQEISSGFSGLNIKKDVVDEGRCEIGILIPRSYVDNSVVGLGKELEDLQKTLIVFYELVTASREDIKINSISSTDLTVFVDYLPEAAALLALATDKLLDVYAKILDIKKKRVELKELGLPESTLESMDDHANKLAGEKIEEIVVELTEKRTGKIDKSRVHELENNLRFSLTRLANKIDNGVNFEFRTGQDPTKAAEGSSEDLVARINAATAALNEVRKIQSRLKFVESDTAPILHLPEPPADGGEKPEEKKRQKK